MESGSRSNRTPQDHAETSRSTAWDYGKFKTEMMKKPQINHIFDIMELDMLLLSLIKLNTSMLKKESNQNQLKQLVELIKMNVNLFIYERDLFQSIIKIDLKECDDLLPTSDTTQASTQYDHDPVLQNMKDIYEKLEKAKANAGEVGFDQNLIKNFRKFIFYVEYNKLAPVEKIKEIYDLLKDAKAKAKAGQVEFGQNLIKDIRRLIQQCHEKVQAEHQLVPSRSGIDPNGLNNDLAELIAYFLPVELRAALAKSNLNMVKRNLEQIKDENLFSLTQRPYQTCFQKSLTEKLINVTIKLIKEINKINQISRVNWRISNLQDDSNWGETMKSHATGIIRLMCNTPKVEVYINRMNSFKDICNQVAAMYKHTYLDEDNKKSERERRTDENDAWFGSFHKDISNEIRTNENYTWCGSFHKDIFNGNCEGAEKFLKEHPLALTAKITVDGNTALHVAVKAKKEEIVTKLIEKLTEEKKLKETLEKQNKEGKTALYIAASGGFSTIAKELVKANDDTLLIKCENETIPLLPLFVAAKYDNNKVVTYLYEEMETYKREKDTSVLEFFPKKNENVQKAGVWEKQWATFLADLIHNDEYDMAIRVNRDYPSLARLRYTIAETPLLALAQRPSLGANKTLGDKASKFRLIPFIGGNKVDRNSTSKASKLLNEIISEIELQSQESVLSDALFKAAEVGSDVFVATIINSLPPALSWLNDKHQNIFHVAIIHRQEKVFHLIYGLGPVKNDLAGTADKFNNWMLHLTGKLAPPHRLNQVPSAALQLQRELKWFMDVKAIVPNSSTNVENLTNNKSPYALFVSQHKNLMEAGEKWIKDAASSCSIVATLITTVVFAAAFTIPAGNNHDSDNPLLLMDTCFLIFVISDAVALFSSCTSVLIFMGILTSRFALEDFLTSLPYSLITGIIFLFISMVAMMSAFGVAIYIIIRHRYVWFYIPIMVAGVVPVIAFVWVMSTLFNDFMQPEGIPSLKNQLDICITKIMYLAHKRKL